MKTLARTKEKGLWLAPLLTALILWELAARYVIKNPAILPRFSDVIFSFVLV